MSVKLMSAAFSAHFHDIEYEHSLTRKNGEKVTKKIKVLAPTAKWVVIALADHANDEGEGAYPSADTLAEKTDLSHVSIISALKALKKDGIISYVGLSKRHTSNYTINKSVLEKMANQPRQKREKQDSKAALPPQDEEGSKAALLVAVKPLYQDSKAALPESSLTILNHPICADAQNAPLEPAKPAEQPKSQSVAEPEKPAEQPQLKSTPEPKKRGDLMDGILHFAAVGADPQVALRARISEYPADVQQTLLWLAEIFSWPIASIPARPLRSNQGGKYAQWILELREMNQVISGHGKAALEAAAKVSEKLSISHPAMLNWCLPAEVGKLSKKRAASQTAFVPAVVDTPLTRALETFVPRQ